MESSNIASNVAALLPLASLRAARDEAARNLTLIGGDLGAAEAALNEEIEQATEAIRARFRDQYGDLIAIHERARQIFERSDKDLRAAVIEEFDRRKKENPKNPDKQIDKALKLSVRVTRKVSIEDGPAAVAWSRVNAPMLIRESVDEKALVKVVETLPELPEFVAVAETVTAVVGEL